MLPNIINTELFKSRFMSKVQMDLATGCWNWIGAKQNAYGKVRVMMKDVRAHRASWLMHKGNIPDGYCVLHQCDNPVCVNPDHLFIGTQSDNMGDKQTKGRKGNTGMHNKQKTHCPSGHELQGQNLYVYRGGRYCKTCRNNFSRNYKESIK